MAQRGQLSECHLVTTSRDDFEANWKRGTDDGQDRIMSQADTLIKKVVFKSKCQRKQAGAELGQGQGKLKLWFAFFCFLDLV